MKKLICTIIGIIMLFQLSSGDVYAYDYSNDENIPYMSYNYLQSYLKSNGIEVYNFKDRKKVEKSVGKFDGELVFIEKIKETDKKAYYARTKNNTGLVYAGKMKNNKPEGIGSVLQLVELISDTDNSEMTYFQNYTGQSDEVYFARVYIGNFKKGIPEGYGIEYISPADESYLSQGINLGAFYEYNGEDIQTSIFDTVNPMKYEGKFKGGKYSGKGNEYWYIGSFLGKQIEEISSLDEYLELLGYDDERASKIKEGLSGKNMDIIIFSGNYKKGKKEGRFKEYKWGYLSYEGNMLDDSETGTGTVYYPMSKQIKYEGELVEGVYDGKGTLYDEDGSILYEGVWKNGEYAH